MQNREITEIVIHDSKTTADCDIGVAEIRKQLKARGYFDIGYHYVIKRDGTIEEGRPINETGVYEKGHNAHSIGICVVGGLSDKGKTVDNFTDEQYVSLIKLYKKYNKNCEIITNHPIFVKRLKENN